MENLKIFVANEAENKEAQELFFDLGYYWAYKNLGKKLLLSKKDVYLFAESNGILGTGNKENESFFNDWRGKEITLQELRDMVVLKRNDVADATHEDYSGLKHLLLTHTRHVWGDNMWLISSADFSKLKPIQKEKFVKEYLEPSNNYSLIKAYRKEGNDWIEVPEGAEVATICGNYIIFWKDEKYSFSVSEEKKWCYKSCDDSRYFSLGEYMNEYGDVEVIWQYHTQPEELPFLDDEPKYTDDEVKYMDENGQGRSQSINDQYAEIEQVRKQTIEETLAERQAQYGCFEDVARTTGKIMEALSEVRVNGLNDLPYPHRMALYMIASKMARIVNGDFNSIDGWHDIGGYSKLIEDLL